MRRLQTADLEGLLDILGEAYADDGPLPFTTELLERLAALMRSESATFIDLDLLHRVGRSYIGCSWDPYLPDGQMTEPYWDELERRPRLIHPTGVAKSSDVSGRPFSGPLHEEQIKLHESGTRCGSSSTPRRPRTSSSTSRASTGDSMNATASSP